MKELPAQDLRTQVMSILETRFGAEGLKLRAAVDRIEKVENLQKLTVFFRRVRDVEAAIAVLASRISSEKKSRQG